VALAKPAFPTEVPGSAYLVDLSLASSPVRCLSKEKTFTAVSYIQHIISSIRDLQFPVQFHGPEVRASHLTTDETGSANLL